VLVLVAPTNLRMTACLKRACPKRACFEHLHSLTLMQVSILCADFGQQMLHGSDQ
jgi:hypothetical protein